MVSVYFGALFGGSKVKVLNNESLFGKFEASKLKGIKNDVNNHRRKNTHQKHLQY